MVQRLWVVEPCALVSSGGSVLRRDKNKEARCFEEMIMEKAVRVDEGKTMIKELNARLTALVLEANSTGFVGEAWFDGDSRCLRVEKALMVGR